MACGSGWPFCVGRPTSDRRTIRLVTSTLKTLGYVIAIAVLAAILFVALFMFAGTPGDAQSNPGAGPGHDLTPSCTTVSPQRFNAALKTRVRLGGKKPKKYAHKPVCVRPHYRKVQRDIRALRKCNQSNLCIGRKLAAKRGWTGQQWQCLKSLWHRESGWNHRAANGSSGAYGIPQSLPGSKMRSAGADWQTNPATQIKWGLGYIAGRYGTPCSAWSHSNSHGWY